MRRLQPQRLANREKAAENRLSADVFVDELVALSDDYGQNVSAHSYSSTEGTGSSLVLLLSDTHCGKLTKYFNSDLFTERILSIPEKLAEDQSVPEDLDEIVVVLAGDMIEGEDIYHTQAHHIEHAVIDQVQIAIRTFWQLLVALKERFNVSIRVESCPGNHGRISRTANGKSNWDNVIYQTLGVTAEAVMDPDITVNVNMDNFHTFPVKDKTAMIYHHGTKHSGTPSMKAKLAGWLHNKEFDFMMHGHWHEWEVGTQFGRPIMKNGSLCGEDDLSEQMAVFDPPRQGFLVVRNGSPIQQFGFLQWENTELD
jgi:calcineurin-like phosphoesterase family protein